MKVPIYWLDRAGQTATSLSEPAFPFVDIEISNGGGLWHSVQAVVDTACMGTMVTRELAQAWRLNPGMTAEMTGNWSKTEVQFYTGNMRYQIFPRMIMECFIGELRLDSDGFPIQALIGIDTLRHGTLVLRPPPAESYLQFEISGLEARAEHPPVH
ncbi:hypothetical protein [Mesorhizobium sp. M0618]|uniref:hypothetical protein n=1 Tax=unclassified Mesorhizobium TaxID=325217 RepID=UPI00333632E2